MPEGFSLGKAFLEVSPDTDGFKDKVKAALDKDKTEVKVKISPDSTGFKDKLTADLAKDKNSVNVKANPDAKDFKAKLDAMLAKDRSSVTVKIKTNQDNAKKAADSWGGDFKKELDKLLGSSDSGGSGFFKPIIMAASTLGPSLIPITATLASSMLPFITAVGAAGVGVGAFGFLAEQMFTQAGTTITAVKTAQTNYNAAIASGTSKAKAYAVEQNAIAAAYKGMSGTQKEFVSSVVTLESAYSGMLKAVTPVMDSALIPWLKSAEMLMKDLPGFIKPIALVFKNWGDELESFLSKNPERVSKWLSEFGQFDANKIWLLGQSLINLFDGVGKVIKTAWPYLSTGGTGFLRIMTEFNNWAGSPKGVETVENFVGYVVKNMPMVDGVLKNLGTVLVNLVKGLSTLSMGDMTPLRAILDISGALAKLTPNEINALVIGYSGMYLALKSVSIAMAAVNGLMAIQAAMIGTFDITAPILSIQIMAISIAERAAAVATAAWTALQWLLDAAVDAMPLIAIAALVAVVVYEIVDHWKFLETWTVRIFDDIKHAILLAWDDVSSFVKKWWPTFIGIITGGLSTLVTLIVKYHTDILNFIEHTWDDIWGFVKHTWDDFTSWVTSWWHSFITGLEAFLDMIKSYFVNRWNDIYSTVKTIITNIGSFFHNSWITMENDIHVVWNRIGNFFTSFWADLKRGVTNSVSALGTAWSNIEGVFKKPVNFLIGTVYDNGIRAFWNKVVGAVGLGRLDLPLVQQLAKGGVIPGYEPGRDTVHAMLSKGEGVLVPEAVRGLGGAAGINAINGHYAGYRGAGSSNVTNHFATGGIPIVSSAINAAKKVGSTVFGDAKKAVDIGKMVAALATGNTTAFTNALDNTIGPAAAGDMGALFGAIPKQLITDIVGAVKSKLTSGAGGTSGGTSASVPGNFSTGTGVAQWTSDVLEALKLNHLPASLLSQVLYQMQTESGGNPNAINLTDSNWKAGDPSRGLLQTIMTTFQAYHIAGTSNNIYDPLANIAAAINYAEHTYGPTLMRGGMGMGSGHGYDNGGMLPPGITMAYNGTNLPEVILKQDQIQQLIQGAASGGNSGNGGGNVTVIMNGYNQDPAAVAQAVSAKQQLMRRRGAIPPAVRSVAG